MSAQPGRAHRLSRFARLGLDPRQIAHQYPDIDASAFSRGVEGLCPTLEFRRFPGEEVGHSTEAIRSLVARDISREASSVTPTRFSEIRVATMVRIDSSAW